MEEFHLSSSTATAFGNNEDKENDILIDPATIFADAENNNTSSSSSKKKSDKKEIGGQLSQLTKRKSAEEIARSQELILKISRYGGSERFKQYLQDNGFKTTPSHLKNLGVPELQELYERIKICVQNKSESNLVTAGVLFAVNIAENVTQKPQMKDKFDLKGWGSYLQNDETFLDSLEQIRLETSIGTALNPYQRLLFSLTTSAVVVSKANARAKADMAMFAAGTPAAAPPQPEDDKEETEAKEQAEEEEQEVVESKELDDEETRIRVEAEEILKAADAEKVKPKRGRPRIYDYSSFNFETGKP